MRTNFRIIARLDIKGKNVIKGIQFEGLRIVGKPDEYTKKYFEQGADEIYFYDSVASLYQRNNLSEIVKEAVLNVFIPITVAGGIRSLEDAIRAFETGADKISINTAVIKSPKLIEEIAKKFGSQAVVLSIDAKKNDESKYWEVYIDGGRERTGINAVEWGKQAADLGAGELFFTSVDRDGTMKGPDFELINLIDDQFRVPVIVGGGIDSFTSINKIYNNTSIDGIAIGAALHNNKIFITDLRDKCIEAGFCVRKTT